MLNESAMNTPRKTIQHNNFFKQSESDELNPKLITAFIDDITSLNFEMTWQKVLYDEKIALDKNNNNEHTLVTFCEDNNITLLNKRVSRFFLLLNSKDETILDISTQILLTKNQNLLTFIIKDYIKNNKEKNKYIKDMLLFALIKAEDTLIKTLKYTL
jgi:hypothetical protein